MLADTSSTAVLAIIPFLAVLTNMWSPAVGAETFVFAVLAETYLYHVTLAAGFLVPPVLAKAQRTALLAMPLMFDSAMLAERSTTAVLAPVLILAVLADASAAAVLAVKPTLAMLTESSPTAVLAVPL